MWNVRQLAIEKSGGMQRIRIRIQTQEGSGGKAEKNMEEQLITKEFDFVIVGGGMAGVCAALAAARGGARTALVENRPVLGGMASSEHRMHICGADHHMSNPNLRETGILEEILLENKRRNPEMNYPVFDAVLWEKVNFQENLELFLNTHMTEVLCRENSIREIKAEQMTTEKKYCFRAPLFMDATGDGTLGARAGAEYRMGREAEGTYGETLAPTAEDHVTMGNSLMFLAKDMGHPVPFVKPFWANTYTEEQLRFRDHEDVTSGYWWIELGDEKHNTITDAEEIRDDLLKTVFGVWDHIKNGGDHGAENLDLEWVSFLPGKRESRRLLGDYVLTQKDCLENTDFRDAVVYGGWPMDIHTEGGMLNESDNPTVWNQVNGLYRIPYRCLYSVNIENLFLGGRAISCSHVAFSSTRVMATCAVAGQAAGTAAAMAVEKKLSPRQVLDHVRELQQRLLKADCYIPGLKNEDEKDLARNARASASAELPGCGAENVINGIPRTVGDEKNCWMAPMSKSPVLSLKWEEEIRPAQVRILLDSNLSREITPSINRGVLARQAKGTPPELIRDFRLIFCKKGEVKKELLCDGKGQRLQVIDIEKEISADEIRILPLGTYGSENAAVFEVRVYGR